MLKEKISSLKKLWQPNTSQVTRKEPSSNGSSLLSLKYIIGIYLEFAKIDQKLNKEELKFIINLYDDKIEQQKIKNIIHELLINSDQLTELAFKLTKLHLHNICLFEEILGSLIELAEIDGVINDVEYQALLKISLIFGFSKQAFNKLFKSKLLEVIEQARNIKKSQQKTIYRELLKIYHPDKIFNFKDSNQYYNELYNIRFNLLVADYNIIKKAA